MSIAFQQVFFSYKKKQVLENISLAIPARKTACIIGPNGGGKSTFLRLCTGDLQPEKGSVTLETESPYSVGFVPQNVHYDAQFPITALEVVLSAFILQARPFGGYPKACKEQARSALDRLGIAAYANTPFSELSTGLAQRVLIARALADQPEILLLDEPTSSVDPEARKAILDLLTSLQGLKTILLVTHDLETAIDRVDMVVCLEKTATVFEPHEVCKHFGIGLYHTPFKKGAP